MNVAVNTLLSFACYRGLIRSASGLCPPFSRYVDSLSLSYQQHIGVTLTTAAIYYFFTAPPESNPLPKEHQELILPSTRISAVWISGALVTTLGLITRTLPVVVGLIHTLAWFIIIKASESTGFLLSAEAKRAVTLWESVDQFRAHQLTGNQNYQAIVAAFEDSPAVWDKQVNSSETFLQLISKISDVHFEFHEKFPEEIDFPPNALEMIQKHRHLLTHSPNIPPEIICTLYVLRSVRWWADISSFMEHVKQDIKTNNDLTLLEIIWKIGEQNNPDLTSTETLQWDLNQEEEINDSISPSPMKRMATPKYRSTPRDSSIITINPKEIFGSIQPHLDFFHPEMVLLITEKLKIQKGMTAIEYLEKLKELHLFHPTEQDIPVLTRIFNIAQGFLHIAEKLNS